MALILDPYNPITYANQYGNYLQTKEYIKDIRDIVEYNKVELQKAYNSSSDQQKKFMESICGKITYAFDEINANFRELLSEVNHMSALIDWKLSALIEQQKITNSILGKILELARIPDSEKARISYLENGMAYLVTAFKENNRNSEYFQDAMECFAKAKAIEAKDHILMSRLGQIHLYSKKYENFQEAENCFLKSAREAHVQASFGGTTIANNLVPKGFDTNAFELIEAEAYLYASRCCQLLDKFSKALEHVNKALIVIPNFPQAKYEKVVILIGLKRDAEAAKLLKVIIEEDYKFAYRVITDKLDIVSKEVRSTLLAIAQAKYQKAITKINELRSRASSGSAILPILSRIESSISDKSLISSHRALLALDGNYKVNIEDYV